VCSTFRQELKTFLFRSTFTEQGIWKWGGGYTINRTYRRPFTSAVRASLTGNLGDLPSPENIEFGIGGDAFVPGLTKLLALFLQSLLGRHSITFLIPPHPSTLPLLFLCKFGQITRPIFSKIWHCKVPVQPVVRDSVTFIMCILIIIIIIVNRHHHYQWFPLTLPTDGQVLLKRFWGPVV